MLNLVSCKRKVVNPSDSDVLFLDKSDTFNNLLHIKVILYDKGNSYVGIGVSKVLTSKTFGKFKAKEQQYFGYYDGTDCDRALKETIENVINKLPNKTFVKFSVQEEYIRNISQLYQVCLAYDILSDSHVIRMLKTTHHTFSPITEELTKTELDGCKSLSLRGSLSKVEEESRKYSESCSYCTYKSTSAHSLIRKLKNVKDTRKLVDHLIRELESLSNKDVMCTYKDIIRIILEYDSD